MSDNIQLARKDIDNICCIYRSVGEAMYDEPRDRLACRFAKRLDEKDTELERLRGLLREASRGILNEIDAVLYFGFMICESVDGRAEVRIKFADLRHAQRLHSALVAIRNATSVEETP